jgi:general secretion pathway protein A
MFENHFGLRENPFVSGHQSRFVYPSREHQEALAHLRFGIENREPFVLITGEVGTGKTTALYDVLSEYESRAVVALITNTSLTRDELLEEVCLRFGLPAAGQLSKPQMVVALERFLKQIRARWHHAILILDEAQNLDRDLLEEIRLLSNLEEQGNKLIQLFLLGQPELEDKLARPELRQLRQRITVFYRLRPLTAEDTEHYIHHRISVAGGHALTVFPVETCREVHEITHGIPREINTVAAQALLNAFVEDSPSVRPTHVRSVERDNEFRSVLMGPGGGRISTLDASPPEGVPVASAPAAASAAPAAPGAAAAASAAAGAAPAGPPPLMPAETHASKASAEAAPAPVAPAPPAPAAVAAAPVAAAPAAPQPSGTPVAPGPPPLHLATGTPDPSAKEESEPVITEEEGAPRRPGVAPAGSSEVWGTWLSSLSQLPSSIDETLEEELAAEAAAHAQATTPVAPTPPIASASAAPSAPPRPEPAPRAEAAAPLRVVTSAATPASTEAASASSAAKPAPRRLEFLDEEPPEEGAKTLRWMILAGFVALIVVGAVLGFRAWKNSSKSTTPTETAAVSPPATETSTTPAPTATGEQNAAPAPEKSAAPPTTTTPSHATPQTASSVPPPPPATSTAAPSHHSSTTSSAPAANNTPPAGSAPTASSPSPGAAAGVAGGTAAGAAAASGGGAAAGGAAASGGAAAGGASVGGSSASAPAKGASGGDAAATQSKPAPAAQALFGVVVGTYMEEERAKEEAAKLASTNLPTNIVSVTENDATMYRLVLGSFDTRKQAEKTASSLIERGLVDEARVVPLGAATASKQ